MTLEDRIRIVKADIAIAIRKRAKRKHLYKLLYKLTAQLMRMQEGISLSNAAHRRERRRRHAGVAPGGGRQQELAL